MLAVRARFTPNNGAGGVISFVSISVNTFTVAFHISLLEISREAMHVLVIRQYSFTLGSEKVGVPNADKTHNNRDISRKFFCSKMFIYSECPFKKLLKIPVSDS